MKQDNPIIGRELPPGYAAGPMQGFSVIGDVTEALHRFILDGWSFDTPPPRIEEDLSFVPKDREEVLYVYMYRVSQNTHLMNSKQWRPSKVQLFGARSDGVVYYERPPLYLNLYYMVGFHSKFRSDTERLMGWLMLRLHDATHLIYRPRKYILPAGNEAVDSLGRPWAADAPDDDNLVMEKVAVGLVDDLTVGDAINFFTIHEAPFRPFLTYRAMCSLEGYLVAGQPTNVRMSPLESMKDERPSHEKANGRLGRMDLGGDRKPRFPIGPPGHNYRPLADTEPDDSEE